MPVHGFEARMGYIGRLCPDGRGEGMWGKRVERK